MLVGTAVIKPTTVTPSLTFTGLPARLLGPEFCDMCFSFLAYSGALYLLSPRYQSKTFTIRGADEAPASRVV
jgi:hypothetical protein